MLTKTCTKCNRELPADIYYFHRQKLGKYGYRSTCKECRGAIFGILAPNRALCAKEGHKFCSKCREELPADVIHFHRTNKTKDGFRSACKKCDGCDYKVKNPNVVYETKEGHKICSVCRQEKALSEFSCLQSSKDGYMSRCKPCDRNIQQSYMQDAEAKKRKSEYGTKYRKKYYLTDKGQAVSAVNCQRRKARKNSTLSCYSADAWIEAKIFFGGKCAYCGEQKELTQEHFVPLSAGGEYTKRNIIPACSWCNGSKKDKDFFDWYPRQKFYSKQREKKVLKYLNYINKDTQQLTIVAI